MEYFSLKKLGIKNKRVLVRVDFNVPVKKGKVMNDKRIRESLPTINYILKKKAKQIILMSHLGRPKGEFDEKYSLKPVAKRLTSLLGKKVYFVDDCLKPAPADSEVVLLENLRFYKDEKTNDSRFAKQLASNADVYVNDAFGTCHRAHASVHAVTRYLRSAPGFLVEKEIKNLSLEDPKKPFVVVLGGSKVSDKINVINNLLKKADAILIGGAMIFTFYKSMGKEIGKSLVEDDKLDLASKLLKKSKQKIILPVDVVCAKKPEQKAKAEVFDVDSIPKDQLGLDIGEESIRLFSSILSKAKTIIWNGPLGMFEISKFAKGTNAIAKILSETSAKTIIGGGDSATAIENLKLQNKMTHVSTGGGASLEFLEGKSLTALKALEQNFKKYKSK
ncbi:MAG: phosphoglycerate kinase [Candidatus Woesearchaeota archaeon]